MPPVKLLQVQKDCFPQIHEACQRGYLGVSPKPTGGTNGKRSAQVRLKAHRRKFQTQSGCNFPPPLPSPLPLNQTQTKFYLSDQSVGLPPVSNTGAEKP